MNALERVWKRNNPNEPLPIEFMPRVSAILPRDVEGEVRVMAAEEFAHKPRPPRSVETVYGELEANKTSLQRTIELARDMVTIDGKLHVELAALIAAGKAESQANIKALEDLEQRVGTKAEPATNGTAEA